MGEATLACLTGIQRLGTVVENARELQLSAGMTRVAKQSGTSG